MITLHAVSKCFGDLVVLDEVEAELATTGVSFLMGPNGVGKTTLVRCLLGLEEYSGEILWNGEPADPADRRMFPVFDDSPAFPALTGLQNLAVLAEESVAGSRQYLDHSVLRRRVKGYSYGQRKRLGLTAALNSGARFLVLDEPTNGLDLDTMRRFKEDVRELSESIGFLITGHHLEFYEDLIDHLFVFKSGKLVEVPMPAPDHRSASLVDAYDVYYPAARG